jgi:DNA-binding protein HU-beta/DNA-binding protein HU-alpha
MAIGDFLTSRTTRPDMNRSELIAAVAARLDTTKGNAAQMVDTVLGVIADRLTEEREEVAIADFGRFSIKQQPERQGINPQTGEKITIEAKEKIVFKASTSLEYYSRKHN